MAWALPLHFQSPGRTPVSASSLSKARTGKTTHFFQNRSLNRTAHEVTAGELLPRRKRRRWRGESPQLVGGRTSGRTGLRAASPARQPRSPRSGCTARPACAALYLTVNSRNLSLPTPRNSPPRFVLCFFFFLPRSLSTNCCVLAQ